MGLEPTLSTPTDDQIDPGGVGHPSQNRLYFCPVEATQSAPDPGNGNPINPERTALPEQLGKAHFDMVQGGEGGIARLSSPVPILSGHIANQATIGRHHELNLAQTPAARVELVEVCLANFGITAGDLEGDARPERPPTIDAVGNHGGNHSKKAIGGFDEAHSVRLASSWAIWRVIVPSPLEQMMVGKLCGHRRGSWGRGFVGIGETHGVNG